MEKLVNLIIQNDVVGINQDGFTLKSGKQSYWYANCRNLSKSHKVLQQTAKLIADFLIQENIIADEIDYVLGVPEGATLLGNEVSRILIQKNILKDKIYSLRAKEKKHGDPANRYWSNGNIPQKIILLEDVTSTGGSVLELANKLKELGIEVVLILSLINRLQLDMQGNSVEDNMKKCGFKFKSISTPIDFLPKIISQMNVSSQENVKNNINQEYFEDYKENSPVKI